MYQKLVDKCKQAYNNGNLEQASIYWKEIYNLLDKELDKAKDKRQRFYAYKKYNSCMEQFTNEEVYAITDYLKGIFSQKTIKK